MSNITTAVAVLYPESVKNYGMSNSERNLFSTINERTTNLEITSNYVTKLISEGSTKYARKPKFSTTSTSVCTSLSIIESMGGVKLNSRNQIIKYNKLREQNQLDLMLSNGKESIFNQLDFEKDSMISYKTTQYDESQKNKREHKKYNYIWISRSISKKRKSNYINENDNFRKKLVNNLNTNLPNIEKDDEEESNINFEYTLSIYEKFSFNQRKYCMFGIIFHKNKIEYQSVCENSKEAREMYITAFLKQVRGSDNEEIVNEQFYNDYQNQDSKEGVYCWPFLAIALALTFIAGIYIMLNKKNIPDKVVPINGFEKKKLIGKGSYGKVYEVRNRLDNNLYAMKKMKLNSWSNSNLQQLIKEIDIMKKLKHDGIVSHFFSTINSQNIIIIMELCDGNLTNFIANKNEAFSRQNNMMCWPEYFISSELFFELLVAIAYLHNFQPEKIIHRDLKPGNILIFVGDENNKKFLKVCDFGLSTFQKNYSMNHTRGIGTTNYMAPEVMNGVRYNEKSDIYSLGIIAQDLFNFKINDLNNLKMERKVAQKFKNLKNVISSMIDSDKCKRPSANDIINNSRDWRINREDLDDNGSLPLITEIFKKKKNYLLQKILSKKLESCSVFIRPIN